VGRRRSLFIFRLGIFLVELVDNSLSELVVAKSQDSLKKGGAFSAVKSFGVKDNTIQDRIVWRVNDVGVEVCERENGINDSFIVGVVDVQGRARIN